MLINLSFKNVSSFKEPQNLSLEISSLKKDDFLPINTITLNNEEKVLKSNLIYGANSSGKTNLIKVVSWFTTIILKSYSDLENNLTRQVVPFLLDIETIQEPSVFEVIFLEENIKYRYGLSIFNGEILEEWLFYTQKRETQLFYRQKQEIEYNKSAFEEAKDFIDTNNIIKKTASYVPFVSVISASQGYHSLNTINFFKRIQYISGINDENLGNYTFDLISKNKEFHQFTMRVLKNFNISDLIVKEEDITPEIELPLNEKREKIQIGLKMSGFNVKVKKHLAHSEEEIELPLNFESAGTRKIIHLLGPIYDTLKKGNILFIDEFDSKFHTLLSKYIFRLFHQHSENSQLIVNVQDTNLMDTELFRRDQIWFIHKNAVEQDSQIYSLAEYKTAIQPSYGMDYLQGAFDAIPLFGSIDEISRLMEPHNGTR